MIFASKQIRMAPLVENLSSQRLVLQESIQFLLMKMKKTPASSGTTWMNLNTTNSFYIETDIRDNFNNSYISPAYKTLKVRREIAQFQETYDFKLLVQGEPGLIIWLHTIVSYLILKFRKNLLEKKNIFLSTISAGPIVQERPDDFGGEIIYSRTISMEAMCEVTWVSDVLEKLEGVVFTMTTNGNQS